MQVKYYLLKPFSSPMTVERQLQKMSQASEHGYGYILIKVYLYYQAAGQIWPWRIICLPFVENIILLSFIKFFCDSKYLMRLLRELNNLVQHVIIKHLQPQLIHHKDSESFNFVTIRYYLYDLLQLIYHQDNSNNRKVSAMSFLSSMARVVT